MAVTDGARRSLISDPKDATADPALWRLAGAQMALFAALELGERLLAGLPHSVLLAPELVVGSPSAAFAHAILLRTEPSPQTTVAHVPDVVRLHFSESVEAAFGAVRVFDVNGRRLDDGPIRRTDADREVDVGVHLSNGTYSVTWRVVSADGHPVRLSLVASARPSPLAEVLHTDSGGCGSSSVPTGKPLFLTLSAANEAKADLTKLTLKARDNLAFGATTREPAGCTVDHTDQVITWTGGAVNPDRFDQRGFEIEGAGQPGTVTYHLTKLCRRH